MATTPEVIEPQHDLIPAEPLPPAHIMLDLETWGTGNNAVIISIGACKFTTDEIIDNFHVAVDPKSCQAHGLEIDPETILWWLDPERDEARRNWLAQERIDIGSALLGFQMWCGESRTAVAIWGNGSTFDNIILRSAYAATGLEYPFRFWQDHCYRTMKQLTPDCAIVREGTHHNALDDAISQAKHLQMIWRQLDATRYRDQLERNHNQFSIYAEMHRAKGTVAGEDKAQVNEGFARDIRQLLDGGPAAA